MAAGDILAVEVGAEGWYADVTVAGVGTGGTYDFGLGANGDPTTGAPRLTLNVVSKSFDDTGAPTTLARQVFGTLRVRKPFPNEGQAEETVVGPDVKIRVSLSEYVYAKDKAGAGNSGTDVQAVVSAGLYTQGGTPSKAATLTATNSSTAPYQPVVANWSYPSNSRLTAGTFPLRCVAFHRDGRDGRPVRAVKFSAFDGTNTVTQTVTATTVGTGLGDAGPVVEYVGSLSTATLTQGATVTANFLAYPWIGDVAFDSSTGAVSPSPLVGPRTYVCDKAGTYGQSFATVDPVGGNDGTGAVVGSGMPTAPFLTIAAAFTALRTYNNTNYARNNCGGSTMYLRTGSHAFIGGTVTVGTTPSTWLEVTRHPSDPASGVIIASQSGGKSLGLMLKISDVTVTATNAAGVVSAGAGSALWVDRCTVNVSDGSSPTFYINTVWSLTGCTITNYAAGIRPFSTTNAAPAIVRGNTIGGLGTKGGIVYTMIGNRSSVAATTTWVDTIAGSTAPTPVPILAYNKITAALGTGPLVKFCETTVTQTYGIAVVQNLFENTTSVSVPLLQIAADGTTGNPVDNVISWHNTIVGQRTNYAYNEVSADSSTPSRVDRRYWSVRASVHDDMNIKGDLFVGSGYVANGSRVGSWPQEWGTGNAGNHFGEIAGIGAPGTFTHAFPGLRSIQPQSPTALAALAFVDRRSYDGSSPGAGGGDYRFAPAAGSLALNGSPMISHDLDGVARAVTDAPGAYVGPVAAVTTLLTAGFLGL